MRSDGGADLGARFLLTETESDTESRRRVAFDELGRTGATMVTTFLYRAFLTFALAATGCSAVVADILVVESAHVRRYADDGTFLGTFVGGLNTPLAVIRSDPDGYIFVSQFGSGEIHKYAGNGTDLGAVMAGHAGWRPTGLAWNDGRLYAASYAYKGLASYAIDAGPEDGNSNSPTPQLVVALPSRGCGVCSAGQRGGVYVTTSDETGSGILGYWTGKTDDPVHTLVTFPEASEPRGIAVAEDEVFVALMRSGRVVKLDREGKVNDWLTGLHTPVGVAVHEGRLYVSSHDDRTIYAYGLADKREQLFTLARTNPQYFAFVPADTTAEKPVRLVQADGSTLENQPVIDVRADLSSAQLPVLSWDTEGGDRAKWNLLLSPAVLSAREGSTDRMLQGKGELHGRDEVVFQVDAPQGVVTWSIQLKDSMMRMALRGPENDATDCAGLQLTLPFDPRATATGPVGGDWTADGKIRLPLLLHAPDLGTMRVSNVEGREVLCRWEGSRGRVGCWATLTIEMPPVHDHAPVTLLFEPFNLPRPDAIPDAAAWISARRGWLNLLQTSTQRPPEQHFNATPGGVWANNVISDPVSSTVFWLGDHVRLLPELAPGISAVPLLRRTVELWVNNNVTPEGRVFYTMEARNMYDTGIPMDSNPSVLIGAWCYVEASADDDWLRRHIDRLEWISRFTEQHDSDGDGLVESPQSGNRNTRAHGDTAWDCISSGHKNAYVNALVYRAWRCLSRLEERLGRKEKAAHYRALADRLKCVYRDTFYNPDTGWLGWWRGADGQLYDLWSDMPTSIAVSYDLITPEDGGAMLDRHWEQLSRTGFRRFDVGLPLTLRPIPPSLMLDGYGGQAEDGSDTFGKYLNGGACVSNTSFWLVANYMAGRRDRADMVMEAMLDRQRKGVFFNGGAFQNGIIDRAGAGAEFFDWEGRPSGYEGHLVYSWVWLQSLILRHQSDGQPMGRVGSNNQDE